METGFRHALIIGASSGMGEAVARRLAEGGTRVALVARRGDVLQRIAESIDAAAGDSRALVYAHDVRDAIDTPSRIQEIARDLGGLDLVVYAAGLMHRITEEEFDCEKDRQMLETNLVGAVTWLNPVAERFGRLGRGTIVGIGSVAGDRGRYANPVYCTAKAGFHAYLEALRNRLARRGVKVVTVKPGFVDTPMTQGVEGLFWLISADRAAELILRAAARGATTAYVPARWHLVMTVIRSIPSFIFRRLRI